MILNDDSLMPFGKFKGIKMSEVPASYLHWCWENLKEPLMNADAHAVIDYIDLSMGALKDENPDLTWSRR